MATRIDLVEDVLPISELRLRAAQQIDKIQKTQRPLVITQYGKAVAVLMEVGQFQGWQDKLTLLEETVSRLEKEAMARGEPDEEEPDEEEPAEESPKAENKRATSSRSSAKGKPRRTRGRGQGKKGTDD